MDERGGAEKTMWDQARMPRVFPGTKRGKKCMDPNIDATTPDKTPCSRCFGNIFSRLSRKLRPSLPCLALRDTEPSSTFQATKAQGTSHFVARRHISHPASHHHASPHGAIRTYQIAGAAVPELHLFRIHIHQLLGHRAHVAVPVHVLGQETNVSGQLRSSVSIHILRQETNVSG